MASHLSLCHTWWHACQAGSVFNWQWAMCGSENPDARIITFRPFYFSLGFTFSLSKFFRKFFCTMECTPSQCTPNVYKKIMCFGNLSCFFKLDLMVWEFFYFSEVKRYKKYSQVRVWNAKLFDSLNQGDLVWHTDMLKVNRRWEGEVGNGPLVPLTYCDGMSYFY